MTQEKKNGKIIAIITMIFLFGMISFVTNLAAPMGIVLKNQFDVSNALGIIALQAKKGMFKLMSRNERHPVTTRGL